MQFGGSGCAASVVQFVVQLWLQLDSQLVVAVAMHSLWQLV
jgi:hypothetical protein